MLTYEEQLNQNLEWALREGSMHFEEGSAVHKTLHRIAQRLDELQIEYAIVGGMAMYLHGFRRFTEDVDILVTPDSLKRIHEEIEGRGFIRPFDKSKNLRDADTRVRVEFLVTGQYPGTGQPGPVAFPDPKGVAEVRNGLKVLKLSSLMELKLASSRGAGRRKDLGDAQELIRTLNLPLDFGDQLDASLRDLYSELWQELHDASQDAPPDAG